MEKYQPGWLLLGVCWDEEGTWGWFGEISALYLGLGTRDGTRSGGLELCLSCAGSGPSSSRMVPQQDSIGKGTEPPLCPPTPTLGVMGTGDMQPLQVGPISIWDEFSEKIWESPSHTHAGMAARAVGQEPGCPSPFPLWWRPKNPARGAGAGTGDTGTSQEQRCVGR